MRLNYGKLREMRQRRIDKKKRAKRHKRKKRRSFPAASTTLKSIGSTVSGTDANNVKAFKNSECQWSQRDSLLDRNMEDTLDQDIQRQESSDCRLKKLCVNDREKRILH